jgi:hypothetical protein
VLGLAFALIAALGSSLGEEEGAALRDAVARRDVYVAATGLMGRMAPSFKGDVSEAIAGAFPLKVGRSWLFWSAFGELDDGDRHPGCPWMLRLALGEDAGDVMGE